MKKNHYLLMELLLGAAVFALVGMTALHAVRSAAAGNGALLCKSNLKQLMQSAASYSADYKALPTAWDGKRTWVAVVVKEGKYFPRPRNGGTSELLCPSAPPARWSGDTSKTYGMADRFQNSPKNGIVLSSVENPVDWPVFSDSVKGNNDDQVYIILKDFNGYVALRHEKKANVAFADGHVAANSGEDLMRFRNPKYYVDRNFFSYSK